MENKKQTQADQKDLRAGGARGHDFTYEPALKNKESLSLDGDDGRTTLNQSAMQEGFREDLPAGHPHAA